MDQSCGNVLKKIVGPPGPLEIGLKKKERGGPGWTESSQAELPCMPSLGEGVSIQIS